MPANENNPSPLVPQGAFQSYGRGKANLKVAIISILTIHTLAIGGFLMQGCKPPQDTVQSSNDQGFSIDDLPPLPVNNTSSPVTYEEDDRTNPDFPFDDFPGYGGTESATVTNRNPGSNAVARTTLPEPIMPGSILGPDDTDIPDTTVTTVPSTPSNTQSNAVARVLTPPAPKTFEYEVVRGDTMSGIAKKHGVKLGDIVKANPDVNPNRIQIGMKLQVPAEPTQSAESTSTTATTTASTGAGTYTVKRGDSLYAIAKSKGTTVPKLKSANGLTSDTIQVGQVLKLP